MFKKRTKMKEQIKNLENLETCVYVRDAHKLLNIVSYGEEVKKKGELLQHLRDNPVYACYFCDGLNYNCESYSTKMEESDK